MSERKKSMAIFIVSILVLVLGLSFILTTSARGKDYEVIVNPENLGSLDLTDRSVVLVDLRDTQDYEKKHIVGAINLPYDDNGDLLEWYLGKNKLQNATIYLMCYSGNRAAKAFNHLGGLDYKKLRYVRFGFSEYVSVMGEGVMFEEGECPCLED